MGISAVIKIAVIVRNLLSSYMKHEIVDQIIGKYKNFILVVQRANIEMYPVRK